MAMHFKKDQQHRAGRKAAAVLFAGALLALTGTGVYAGLNAVATGTAAVTSGTLSLTLAAGTGSGGFPMTVSNMAPGDVVNTYVNVTNGSNLAGQALTLGVAGTGGTLLTTSATNGLQVAVTQCSVAWTATTGLCSGANTPLSALTAVSTLSGTPTTLVAGAVAPSAVYRLQVEVMLPNQSETTTNGVPPSNSIQGLSTTLTFTFSENQRAAATTNV
jgi:spore coat-associated protein N